jgi:two-component system cell cycle sensor histidine kinase/response regulator CckA
MERADFDQWKPKDVARLLALVETERRYYREIVANIPVSLLIVGANLSAVSSNRQLRMKLGKKNDELLGNKLSELLPIEGLEELAQQVLGSGAATPRQTLIWDGNPVVVTVLPLRSWEGDSDPEALIVVEELGQVAPALTPIQAKELDIAASIDGMLWEVDYAAGGITHVSKGAEALFGYPVERWLEDKSVWGLRIAPRDRKRVDAFYDQLSSSPGQVFSIEFHALHANGQEFVVRETVRVQRDEQAKPIRLAGLSTNVTERHELEQQSALSHKSEALQRISAKLAHDLNNLLMIVAGYGEELKNALPPDNPLHQDMKEILGATERLYALSTQFQTYTRKPQVSPKITNLNDLFDQLRSRMAQQLGSGVVLEIEAPADLAKAKVDAAQLEEALLGLSQQAELEMNGTGSLSIRAVNVLKGEASFEQGLPMGAYVRITLEHSGSTLRSERLLEPWLEADDKAREIELTAATAYQIVKQSQGDLTVDGRRFHLDIPVVSEVELEAERMLAASQASIPPPVVEAPAEAEPTLETILVVEDEGGIRALVRKILRRQGYQVLEASGGEEALQVLEASGAKVDLLLTDVMMPGMNGVELSQRALSQFGHLKVLFLSGYTDESVLESGQFPVGTAFLQKPFTLGSLLGKVREVLDGSAARQAAS